MNRTSPPLPSENILAPGAGIMALSNTVLSSLECLVNFSALPVSVPNFLIIFRTQIIHKNLKFILLCQCLSVVLLAIMRIIEFWCRIVLQNMIYQNFVLCSIRNITIVFGNLLLVCLFFERCVATKFVRDYEHQNSNWFSVFCLFYLFSMTAFAYLITENPESPTMLKTNDALRILALVCFANLWILIYLWHLLYKYNCRRYASMKDANNVQQKLSERYQLSENIRTFRQLFPSVVLHFFTDFLTLFGYMTVAVKWIADDQMVNKLVGPILFLLFAIANLLIQITVIIFHPILNRDFSKMLRSVFARRNNQVNDNVEPCRTIASHIPTDINGKNLMMTQGAEDHFRMLLQSWR